MGKKYKDHKKKVQARNMRLLNNPITRKAVAFASRGKVIQELVNAPLNDQLEVLNTQVEPNKLKKAIMGKAPKQMDKAIEKFRKEGKPITVDTLLVEIKSEVSFLKMCENIGLTIEWFENLAKSRMGAHRI